jgi:hypothetical protein
MESPLWGTASQSNLETLQRFQNKVLRTIVNAPWYVPNSVLHIDLSIPTVREEITKLSVAHKDKLSQHPNQLLPILLEEKDRNGSNAKTHVICHKDSYKMHVPRH